MSISAIGGPGAGAGETIEQVSPVSGVPSIHIPKHGLVEVTWSIDPGSQTWREAAAVEADVFIEKGYVASAEELDEEYKPYESMSSMAALSIGGVVVGAMRVGAYHPEHGFKTVEDAKKGKLDITPEGWQAINQMDMQRTLEVGTLALREEFRGAHGMPLVGKMYGAIYGMSLRQRVDDIIASFDAPYYAGFERRFRPAATALGPAKNYMGSLTVPAHIDVTRVSPTMFMPRTK